MVKVIDEHLALGYADYRRIAASCLLFEKRGIIDNRQYKLAVAQYGVIA